MGQALCGVDLYRQVKEKYGKDLAKFIIGEKKK
jgi:hypothetical protein